MQNIQKHKYDGVGRQEPLFFIGKQDIKFWLEYEDDDDVEVLVSYDPARVRNTKRIWEKFEGGSAGRLEGPPVALRVNIKQAAGPVFLCVENEHKQEER